MIARSLVLCLGLSQLVCWGISYYLVGALGEHMVAGLGWSRTEIYGGFSLSLVVMGLVSQVIGRAIDRHGGRPVMVTGSLLTALGCCGLAASSSLALYYLAWIVLGVAMRMTLYDAAFAALARIGGAAAARPISQITLLGGFASTVFWPIGAALADWIGWRGALLAYAACAIFTVPLHAAIPKVRHQATLMASRQATPLGERRLAAFLYAFIMALTAFLNSAMSAHLVAILEGLGLGAGLAVTIGSLRGVGQSAARLCEVLFGRAFNPFALAAFASLLLPLAFIAGDLSAASVVAGIAFAFLYGAGNGLLTIVRGTLPLHLFDAANYGAIVGRLLMPSLLLSALAPLACAAFIERFGNIAVLRLSAVFSLLAFAATLLLWTVSRRSGVSRGTPLPPRAPPPR